MKNKHNTIINNSINKVFEQAKLSGDLNVQNIYLLNSIENIIKNCNLLKTNETVRKLRSIYNNLLKKTENICVNCTPSNNNTFVFPSKKKVIEKYKQDERPAPPVQIVCTDTVPFSGNTGIYEFNISVGTDIGLTGIKYDGYTVPDRFQIFWNDELVADSKYVGGGIEGSFPPSYSNFIGNTYSPSVYLWDGNNFTDTGQTETFTITQDDLPNHITEPINRYGFLSFYKDAVTPTHFKVKVYGPKNNTVFNAAGVCPVSSTEWLEGYDILVYGFYPEAVKFLKTESIKIFYCTEDNKFYTNRLGHTEFNYYGWSSNQGGKTYINDGTTWWNIDNVGNILSSGYI